VFESNVVVINPGTIVVPDGETSPWGKDTTRLFGGTVPDENG
jgi:hypothetical protein